MRALVTRGAGLLAAGMFLAMLNSPGPAVLSDPPLALLIDRQERPSRSLQDRLDVQSGVVVPQGASIPITTATASAEAAPRTSGAGEDGPICISSPLEPGTFQISSSFGMRLNPITGFQGLHAGADLATAMSAPIYAVADGIVTYTGAGQAGRSPELVIIEHEIERVKFSSWYVHMYPHGVFVEAGQEVRAGEHIADVGSNGFSTGPHLHFEIHTPLGGPSGNGMGIGSLLSMGQDPAAEQTSTETDDPDESEGAPELAAVSSTELSSTAGPARENDDHDDSQEPQPGGDDFAEGADEAAEDPGQEHPDEDAESEPVEPSPTKAPRPEEEDADVDSDPESKKPGRIDGADFEVPVKDDEGKNDHTIRYTVSRSTGFFDPGSLGMVHDPIPFLEALGYGIVAPNACAAR